jgi:hypothetical protein
MSVIPEDIMIIFNGKVPLEIFGNAYNPVYLARVKKKGDFL